MGEEGGSQETRRRRGKPRRTVLASNGVQGVGVGVARPQPKVDAQARLALRSGLDAALAWQEGCRWQTKLWAGRRVKDERAQGPGSFPPVERP
jgi:hypothetical protein